jgi:hypothetical protein
MICLDRRGRAPLGATRQQLVERSEVRQPIRAHDLRATFVTIALKTETGTHPFRPDVTQRAFVSSPTLKLAT